jgi:hypothetical protein
MCQDGVCATRPLRLHWSCISSISPLSVLPCITRFNALLISTGILSEAVHVRDTHSLGVLGRSRVVQDKKDLGIH